MIVLAPVPWSISDLKVGFPGIEINDATGCAIARVLWSKTQADNVRLIVAAPLMLGALRQWKCGRCGGAGRDYPKFSCTVCGGNGLNPIAGEVIKQIEGTQP